MTKEELIERQKEERSARGDAIVASNSSKKLIVAGAGTGKTYTMASIIQEAQRPALVMAHNKTLAAQLCQEFRAFFPENSVQYFI